MFSSLVLALGLGEEQRELAASCGAGLTITGASCEIGWSESIEKQQCNDQFRQGVTSMCSD